MFSLRSQTAQREMIYLDGGRIASREKGDAEKKGTEGIIDSPVGAG
jgi:hypothetical protein